MRRLITGENDGEELARNGKPGGKRKWLRSIECATDLDLNEKPAVDTYASEIE